MLLNDVPSRLGRYQLRYRIAVGGMGGVYLARATGAGGADKVVAVKLVHEHLAADQDVVKMFLDEARIVSAINHVNVSAVFDFGEQDGLHYLVMEYLEGEPLYRVLKSLVAGTQRHPQHPWLVARILADAAEGLHAAHSLQSAEGTPLDVVHRDVSPQNLFVTYDGITKVVDFGIAHAKARSTATEAGTFKGKFEYAAPEQIRGRKVDRRADIWALGVCLWELLVGVRLFQRDDPTATGMAVLEEPLRPPSEVSADVPPGFDAITMRALSRDPAARFQTARDFSRALRDLLSSSGQAIDAPLVGDWLDDLFPGDRVKRQTLFASVRRSPPEAPVEQVPAELRVKDTGTGSLRAFRSSASGIRAVPEVTHEQPETGERSSSAAALVTIALLLLTVIGAAAFVLLTDSKTELTTAIAPPATPLTAVPTPTPPEPPVVALVVIDAGEPAELDGGQPRNDPPEPKRPRPVLRPLPLRPEAPVQLGGRRDGRVRFKTPGAVSEVVVDGKLIGTTPLTVELPAGLHTFELKAKGYDFGGPQQLRVQVGGDYNVDIDTR